MKDSQQHNNLVRLAERRKERNNLLMRQKTQTLDQRVADLESDLLRAIEQVIDLTQRLEDQERYFRLLLKALHKET
jgi:hypothetical protein